MKNSNYNFSSGLTGLDELLQNLKPGDNVVLKVGSVADYLPFVEPFVQDCLKKGLPLIYFRFARHRLLVEPKKGVEIHELHPESGFENFIGPILDIIEEKGLGACYVFDCLSDLAVDWYSERMLGNFFMLACPYLFQLDTIAYFALIRDRHSPLATHAITNTAQVVLDIYQNQSYFFIHPQKVEGRFSCDMYTLHRWRPHTEEFQPVRNSAVMSRILGGNPQTWLEFTIQRPDVWTEYYSAAKAAVGQGYELHNNECRKLHERLLRMALTRDDRLAATTRKYLLLPDVVEVIKRMIGTGLVGGKSLGMLLARAILMKRNKRWKQALEMHDSFFIGSDVFYTFLVLNQCWWPRRKRNHETIDEYLERAEQVQEIIMKGTFPSDIREQFEEMLNYFGQSPIIVRSSSLQEDSYGNAFSGKYESVFCANQGSPENRMKEFINAVLKVYASTMRREALIYRRERNLLEREEQMALLVQRVSGGRQGRYFYPPLAGTGFSFNPYAWGPGVKREAGMLRLVLGLGTRAVDRVEDDYTRLVALNAPGLRPPGEKDNPRAYRQKKVDVIDLQKNVFTAVSVEKALAELPEEMQRELASLDREMARRAREYNVKMDSIPLTLDFDKLLQNSLAEPFREILHILQDAYSYPVDIEFTINFAADCNIPLINIVQCRPFQVKTNNPATIKAEPESLSPEQIILRSSGPIIGQGIAAAFDNIIYIAPAKYSKLSEQKRYSLARLIGRLTNCLNERGESIMLIGPGRWCTSSPSLGVPVSFSEIKNATVLCEIAAMHEGLIPDISLGTHFFNDLVEMDMLYLAVFPDREGNMINEELLLSLPNQLAERLPADSSWQETVHLAAAREDSTKNSLYLYANPANQKASSWLG